MANLTGKVALVTGGSKGIGRATCLALAKAGARVVINYSSVSSSADSLVQEIGAERAIAVKADAGSVQGAEEMVKCTLAQFGAIDVVVANAGEFPSTTLTIDFKLTTYARDPANEGYQHHYRSRL